MTFFFKTSSFGLDYTKDIKSNIFSYQLLQLVERMNTFILSTSNSIVAKGKYFFHYEMTYLTGKRVSILYLVVYFECRSFGQLEPVVIADVTSTLLNVDAMF